ncbi:MAG: hypothetical protein K0S79_1433, partial [Nitrospira sp.]|nr:hypothetical protein [Nitrospira sp.]
MEEEAGGGLSSSLMHPNIPAKAGGIFAQRKSAKAMDTTLCLRMSVEWRIDASAWVGCAGMY